MKFLRFLPMLGLFVLLAGCNKKEHTTTTTVDSFRLAEPMLTLRNNVQGFNLTSLPLEQVELTDSFEVKVSSASANRSIDSTQTDTSGQPGESVSSDKFTLTVMSNCDVGDGSNTHNQKTFNTPHDLSIFQLIPSQLFLGKPAANLNLHCSFGFEAKNQFGSTHKFEIQKVKIIADRLSANMVFPHWMKEGSNKTIVKNGVSHFISSEFLNETLSAGPSQLSELNFDLKSIKNFKQVFECEHLKISSELIKTGTFSGLYFLKSLNEQVNQKNLKGTEVCRISILDESDELLYFSPLFNMSWANYNISVTFDKKDPQDEFVLNRLRNESEFFRTYALPLFYTPLFIENKGDVSAKIIIKNLGGQYLPFAVKSETTAAVVKVMNPEIGIMGPPDSLVGADIIVELAPKAKYEVAMFFNWLEKCDYVRDFIGYGFTSLDGVNVYTYLKDSNQNWKEIENRVFLPAARSDLHGPAGSLTSAVSATAQDGEKNLATITSMSLIRKRLDQMNIEQLCH